MEGYVFNLFSLSGIDPSHVIRYRFVVDCPLSLLQFTSSPQVQRTSTQTGAVSAAPLCVGAPYHR